MKSNHENIPGISPGVELLSQLRPYVRQCGDTPRGAWKIDKRCLLDYLLVYIENGTGVLRRIAPDRGQPLTYDIAVISVYFLMLIQYSFNPILQFNMSFI